MTADRRTCWAFPQAINMGRSIDFTRTVRAADILLGGIVAALKAVLQKKMAVATNLRCRLLIFRPRDRYLGDIGDDMRYGRTVADEDV